MTNLHAPQRLANETGEAYRERRAASKKFARAGRYLTRNSLGRVIAHSNPLANRRRAAIKAAGGVRQFKRNRSAPLRDLRDAACR